MPEPTEQLVAVDFPESGIDTSSGTEAQRDGTTPDAVNVVLADTYEHRDRGGSRPGLVAYVAQQLPTGVNLIQHLNVIVDPTTDALLDTFDYDGPRPIFDPSSIGPPASWPAILPGGEGTRNPGRYIPDGGWARQPNKNKAKKLAPKIIWAEPAAITVGTALSGVQLNATAVDPVTGAAVAGVFTYTPAAGTVLGPGENQLLSVAFVPTNQTRFRNVSSHTQIDVRYWSYIGATVDSSGLAVLAGDLSLVWVQVAESEGAVTPTDSLGTTYLLAKRVRIDLVQGVNTDGDGNALSYAVSPITLALWYGVVSAPGSLQLGAIPNSNAFGDVFRGGGIANPLHATDVVTADQSFDRNSGWNVSMDFSTASPHDGALGYGYISYSSYGGGSGASQYDLADLDGATNPPSFGLNLSGSPVTWGLTAFVEPPITPSPPNEVLASRFTGAGIMATFRAI